MCVLKKQESLNVDWVVCYTLGFCSIFFNVKETCNMQSL